MTERCLFLATLEIEDPAARLAYLDEACAGDSALRAQVEQLLLAHHATGHFMERPAPTMVAATDEIVCGSGGTVIGPYRLMEQIGEGGMGLVFVAEQHHPLRRKVAVKVIKPGLDTREVIARFEAERHALALMDHPNIARVLDAGATESGRPYFVMELVRGVAITRFCDENRLNPRERLELFVHVCQAVQHAHQKGIIHRDLKPANILVTLHDGTPVVKVIDFGVAKAIGPQLSDRTVYTRFAQMIGTPMYMSPEQAEMSGLDIDTRSDIYALGVLLYELLAGVTPFDHERLRTAAFDEFRRIVREEDPPRPSERISTLCADALSTVSTQRRTDSRQLSQLVRGELDWIVMKALEKDRRRRYETASDFAADVMRFLADRPVEACPASRSYRLRKLARRNRAVFITAAGLTVGLLLAVATLAVSNVRIRAEQWRTRAEKDRAENAVQLAEERAREIRLGLERLKSAIALVDRARIYAGDRRWDDASASFTRAIQLRPELAPAWEGRGSLYARLGLWDLAASDLGKAFELQEPATHTGWLVLAVLRAQVGDLPGYRVVCRRMADRFEGTAVLRSTMDMVRAGLVAPESGNDPARLVELAQGVVAVQPGDSYYLHTLGAAHYRAGQDEPAMLRLRQALEEDPRSEARMLNYPLLAMAHHRMGRQDQARQALDEVSRAFDRWMQEMYTRGHEDWGIHQGATGSWPFSWWDWLVCQLHYREARTVMGLPPPPDDFRMRVLRARAFAGLRWMDRAVAEYAAALKLNPCDRQTRVEAHRSQGLHHVARREWDRAADEYARACELQPEDPLIWESRAITHLAAGDVGAYRRVCATMLERFEWTEDARTAYLLVGACTVRAHALPDMARLVGPGRVAARWYPGAGRLLAAALCRAGAYDAAVKCFQDAARHYRLRAQDWLFLAMAHHGGGHTEAARTCLARAVQWVQEADSQEADDVAGTRPDWGDWEEPPKVRHLLREAETLIRGEKAGPALKPW